LEQNDDDDDQEEEDEQHEEEQMKNAEGEDEMHWQMQQINLQAQSTNRYSVQVNHQPWNKNLIGAPASQYISGRSFPHTLIQSYASVWFRTVQSCVWAEPEHRSW
jgi:hypothetical protein